MPDSVLNISENEPRPTIIFAGGPVQTINEDYSESCPVCSTKLEPEDYGYGLAFGGIGSYITCSNVDCDWFVKVLDVE